MKLLTPLSRIPNQFATLLPTSSIMYQHKFALLVLSTFLVCVNCRYEVPEPKFQIGKRCFKVSIPDEEGIELFAFHGNVNKEMEDLEAGEMSQDVLKKRNGKWTYKKCKKLKRGDKIYYWLYVQKRGLGYRLDDGVFTFNGKHMAGKKTSHTITRRDAYWPTDGLQVTPYSNPYKRQTDFEYGHRVHPIPFENFPHFHRNHHHHHRRPHRPWHPDGPKSWDRNQFYPHMPGFNGQNFQNGFEPNGAIYPNRDPYGQFRYSVIPSHQPNPSPFPGNKQWSGRPNGDGDNYDSGDTSEETSSENDEKVDPNKIWGVSGGETTERPKIDVRFGAR